MIYLLSILDGANAAGVAIIALSAAAAFMCGLVCLFSEYDKEDHQIATARKVGTVSAWAFAGALAFVALVPSSESLLRAYLMVEGSKIVTAQNAAKATAEIVKRVDTLISKIGGGK